MGDRANIVFEGETPEQDLYLYSHWGGTELWATLQHALQRGAGRWRDPAYLARIVFSEMIARDIKGETGYGISVGQPCDWEWPHLIIKTSYSELDQPMVKVQNGRKFTFDEYLRLTNDPRR